MTKNETANTTTNTIIIPADIEWHQNDNNTVPISKKFGDIYYSLVDGLAESRYVFIDNNNLTERFEQCINNQNDLYDQSSLGYHSSLREHNNFTIIELGFGTGLNFFVTLQLWQQLKQQNTDNLNAHDLVNSQSAHLHFISLEKHPLTKADFAQSLSSWRVKNPEINQLIDELLDNYPILIAGCHRLHISDNVTLDLWFGDASDSLDKISAQTTVDAWFLDGFAPSCNESLWSESIFKQIDRLSTVGTTVATFSCAGIVKRGLTDIGFDIKKIKGFGHKREMLTAQRRKKSESDPEEKLNVTNQPKKLIPKIPKKVAVIGAGVSGLMSAWSLANRGIQVILIDKSAPLAGASGNPRGVLAPKMTPIHHVAEHLHSTGYLYSSRIFKQMSQSLTTKILEPTAVLDLLLKSNICAEQINDYPDDFAHVLTGDIANQLTGIRQQDLAHNQYLPQAGLINPQALARQVLAHPLIEFQRQHIVDIDETDKNVILITDHGTEQQTLQQLNIDHTIVCMAYESCQLDKRIFDFRKIRGQLSWFTVSPEQLEKLPKIPLKYGGYCAKFTDADSSLKENDQKNNDCIKFLIGASFIRNDIACDIRMEEHHINRNKLITAIPELDDVIPADLKNWQARVGVRSQTPDYHPLVGRVGKSSRVWTMSGMGAKGYAFAPICAELLADMMTERIPALSKTMIAKLSPNRERLQKK